MENMEGALTHEQQLYEELDSLHIKFLNAPTDQERDQILARINEIEKELGVEETLAA